MEERLWDSRASVPKSGEKVEYRRVEDRMSQDPDTAIYTEFDITEKRDPATDADSSIRRKYDVLTR